MRKTASDRGVAKMGLICRNTSGYHYIMWQTGELAESAVLI